MCVVKPVGHLRGTSQAGHGKGWKSRCMISPSSPTATASSQHASEVGRWQHARRKQSQQSPTPAGGPDTRLRQFRRLQLGLYLVDPGECGDSALGCAWHVHACKTALSS